MRLIAPLPAVAAAGVWHRVQASSPVLRTATAAVFVQPRRGEHQGHGYPGERLHLAGLERGTPVDVGVASWHVRTSIGVGSGPARGVAGEQRADDVGQPRLDVHDGVGEFGFGFVEVAELGAGGRHLPHAPAIAVAVATTLCAWSNRNGVTVHSVELTSAVTAMVRVLNALTLSSETFRSRFSGVCASRSQNSGRETSECARTAATSRAV
jgi:hypothetical protein